MMPHLEQTVWSDTPLVLLPSFPYAVALDFSGLGSLLISKAQLTQLWPCFFINFTSDRGYFTGIASQRIPTLCPCCESLTLPGCVWSSVAPACTLVLETAAFSSVGAHPPTAGAAKSWVTKSLLSLKIQEPAFLPQPSPSRSASTPDSVKSA